MKKREAEFKPNYLVKCISCDQKPTIDIYVNNKLENSTELCGACTWGEASALDPNNWQ